MPHYQFPSFIGRKAKLITLHGDRYIQFTPLSLGEAETAIKAGAIRLMTDVLVPTDSPHFRPKVGPDETEVYRIDSSLRIYHVREKQRYFENMPFPKGTMALVIDTDQPVSQHYSDNMCSYCTGLIGMTTETFWMSRFYEEMSVGADPTPYAKYGSMIVVKGKLYPSSPWPTPSYATNGTYSFVNTRTKKKLNKDEEVSLDDLMLHYQWPARMSVAMLFRKVLGPEDLMFNIIKGRAGKFIKEYPNAVEGKYHNITNIRWVDTRLTRLWNEYEDEEEVRQPTRTVLRSKSKGGMHQDVDSYNTFWNDRAVKVYRPKKRKIEIEEITSSTYDL